MCRNCDIKPVSFDWEKSGLSTGTICSQIASPYAELWDSKVKQNTRFRHRYRVCTQNLRIISIEDACPKPKTRVSNLHVNILLDSLSDAENYSKHDCAICFRLNICYSAEISIQSFSLRRFGVAVRRASCSQNGAGSIPRSAISFALFAFCFS